VYRAARSAFTLADDSGIESFATYLWAIRDRYATARPADTARALISAAADHGADAVNLRRVAICALSSDHARYWLAVEALLQVRDLSHTQPYDRRHPA
jgi:hypothetical protein